MKLHEKIYDLTPFQSENFLRIPGWEDGCYIPSINVWQIAKNKQEYESICERIKKYEYDGYESTVDTEFIESQRHWMVYIEISPKHDYNDEMGYYCIKEDWSIDEMIEIAKKIVHPHPALKS